jgi:site-specific recombinase XerD
MKPAKRFKITPFTNPSGDKVYRISGTLDGVTVRKNFKKRKDATECQQQLEIKYMERLSEGQTVWTTLTHEENRDAIAAANILKKTKFSKSLTFAVNYMIEHYREAEHAAQVEDVVESYLKSRDMDQQRSIITLRQYKAIRAEMNTFKMVFGERGMDTISSDELKEYLEGKLPNARNAVSLKTWNNRRGYLSTFYKFCLLKKHVAADPVIYVPKFKIQKARGTAATLSAEKAKNFMHWLETYKGQQNKDEKWWGVPGCMVPYFALCLFAGIRPDWETGEMSSLRPEHVRLDTDVIFIEPEVSKVNEKRSIKIQPNLRKWLEKYPLSEYPILPPRRLKHMFREIRKHWKLPPDVMRHTFISMTVGAFRSVGDASLQAGNSEAVIRKHYLDLKSVEEADVFWGIVPAGEELPEMEKKDGRYVVPAKSLPKV